MLMLGLDYRFSLWLGSGWSYLGYGYVLGYVLG